MPRLLLVALVLLAGCSAAPLVPEEPRAPAPEPAASEPTSGPLVQGIIRPLRLTAGRTDTVRVGDLVFTTADPTTIAFEGTDDVAVVYDPASGTAAFSPRYGFSGLDAVTMQIGGETLTVPVESRVQTTHTFRFDPDVALEEGLSAEEAVASGVYVMGAFNDWARMRDRLVDTDGDGTLEATLDLDPGVYPYKFHLGDEARTEVMDPAEPARQPNGFGGFNNLVGVEGAEADLVLRPLPRDDRRRDLAAIHEAFPFEVTLVTNDGEAPVAVEPEDVVALLDNRRVGAYVDEPGRIAALLIGGEAFPLDWTGPSTLRVAVQHAGLVSNWVEVPLVVPPGTMTIHPISSPVESPFQWQDAVLYQILIDRFLDGDPSNSGLVPGDSIAPRANYRGGDLAGIRQRLDEGYFRDLGVNVLWLSPVYDNPDVGYVEYPPPHRTYTGYHGYWPVASDRVEPRFGSLEELRDLVDAAHAQGIRVILDFVANHVHEEHPLFSAHREWFGTLELPDGSLNLRRWDEHRLTTWFEPYLPSFDFENNPDAVAWMADNAAWWIEQTGIDGFRHDAVKHIPNGFWSALTHRLRTAFPDRELYQIGETFGGYDLIGSYVNPSQLDAQFNFPLYDAALGAFLNPEGSFGALAGELQRNLGAFGPRHVMGTLMDSHDKPRFLALADGDIPPGTDDKAPGWSDTPPGVDDPASYDLAELYLAFLLTTPGVPTIYYGDEIGMTGANDPDNRRVMRFGDELTAREAEQLQATRRLVRLRRDHAALRHGHTETVYASRDAWAYVRALPGETVLVVLNKGSEAFSLPLGTLPDAYRAGSATDLLSGGAASGTVSVPPMGYGAWRLGS